MNDMWKLVTDIEKKIRTTEDGGAIKTDEMILEKNVLKFSNTTIQLSSISKVDVTRIENKGNFPYYAIGGIIIAIVLVLLNLDDIINILSIGVMLVALWYVYRWYSNRKKEALFLSLELNSGKTYNIHFLNFDFANQVRSAIEKAFNNTLERSLTFNVNGNNNSINSNNLSVDNSINNSGNNNSGNSSIGHQYNSSTLQILDKPLNWTMIQEELDKVIDAIQNPDSSIRKASEEALKLAKEKDSLTFIDYIKRNKHEFTSAVFSNVASAALLEIFAQIIK